MLQKSLSRNINSILSKNRTIGSLYTHSLEILKLQSALRSKLDPSLKDHVYITKVNPDNILIYTDSPVWASKLRFLTTEILNIVKNVPSYKKIETVRIKVSPSLGPISNNTNQISISPLTAKHLEQVAENINDSNLQSSLLKLAQNR